VIWSLVIGAVVGLGIWGGLERRGPQPAPEFAQTHHETVAQLLACGAAEAGDVVAIVAFALMSLTSAAAWRR
jgi:hypothetical protein